MNTDIIDRIIEFCDSLDSFSPTIRGASQTDIDMLEIARGQSLHPAYRHYLERMGLGTGWIQLGMYSTDPRELLEYRSEDLRLLPPNIELFAFPVDDSEDDIFLLFGHVDEPRVVAHEPVSGSEDGFQEPEADLVAGSLSELLCLPALNSKVVLKRRFQSAWMGSRLEPPYMQTFRDIATRAGFEPFWFSNEFTWAAQRQSLILIAKQSPAAYFSLGIAGDDERAWSETVAAMRENMDLKPLSI